MSRTLQFLILALILIGLGLVSYLSFKDLGVALAQKPNSPESQVSPARPGNPCSPTARNPCSPTANKPRNPCSPTLPENEIYEPATNFAAWTRINASPVLSDAHEGLWVVTYVNTTAQRSIDASKTTFPIGSKLITDCFIDDNGEPGKRVAVFAMEKRNDGWLWVKTNIQGMIMRGGNSSMMKNCVECHKSAPTDSVFLGKTK